ncbi:RNA polymerase sigma-70 factor [Siphonobacter sp. SORGH_AS_0500]|uniref:RNA polymerase sigma factor n=1 Tax=Siphonobacter sp. SORGH_AS_0500 TaxID=1864824 RepID=UPI00285CC74B|nr:RNA polymerase sigma-70 factor [Siphonobacter sp. SORGH_AS_0500]MDR6193316.1 RNA polymerase sigma-70 factor (family 1) [Siphonobacter sp. SORGH_AS_0500]
MSLLLTDFTLVTRVSNGDERAFRILFHRYRNKLFRFSLRYVKSTAAAEDILQDTFLKIWEQRQSLQPELNFEAYLFRISRNQIFNEFKKSAYHAAFEQFVSQNAAEHQQTESEVVSNDYQEILQSALERLPPQRRQIFQLSRMEGLSHEEIAQQLNISKNTIKVQINKALKSIRQSLEMNSEVSVPIFLLVSRMLYTPASELFFLLE